MSAGMFRRIGVNAKLTLITLASILLSLLVAGAANLWYDRKESYEVTVEELSVLASVIADRTAASVVFNDPELAAENLAALAARSTVDLACAFDDQGTLIATYHRQPLEGACRSARGVDLVEELPGYILIVKGIQLDGNRVGEIQIRSDLSELEERLQRIVVFGLAVALGATLIVLLVAQRLQRWVSRPILELSDRARTITRDKDYSIRARKSADDELGLLVDAFNGMLETIEMQNRSLIEANLELERKVLERSRELRQAQTNLLRQERLATLGQLTGTVSHELRNPLGTIQASVDLLKQRMTAVPEELQRPLERIERNIHRCENIINELLDYSRGSSPHLQTVDVDTWLTQLVTSAGQESDIPMEVNARVGIAADLDPERMRRALINLLDNARHALAECVRPADSGPPVIRVEGRLKDGRIWISVSDNGPGIPAEVCERVFEPLFSTRAFGVGLGLAIVKQILEQHGGEVGVVSREGEGTEVTLWLPVDRGKPEKQRGEHAAV